MTLAVSRGFTPRATASVMMLVRSPRAVSLMTFQSLNVVSGRRHLIKVTWAA